MNRIPLRHHDDREKSRSLASLGTTTTSRAEVYEARRRERASARDESAVISRRLAWARLAAFAATFALVWVTKSSGSRALGVGAAVAFVVFVWLVRRHRREKERVEWLDALARVNADAASRVRRDWSALPKDDWPPAERSHPYADDLDLTGPVSLSRLLPRVSNTPGRDTIRSWLLDHAEPQTVRERQAAVAELAPMLDFRDALSALGRRIWLKTDGRVQLERWAVGEAWLERRTWLAALSIAVSAATVGLIALGALRVVPPWVWSVPLTVGVVLTAIYSKRLRRTLSPVANKADTLGGYAEMTRLVATTTFTSPLLERLRAEMSLGGQPAYDALASLRTLADCSEVRSSPMLYVVLQAIGLWDFHVVHAVERWQRRHGHHVARWLVALGEVESLSALAALADGHPSWTFPDVADDATTLEAKGLGHPLLADDVGVRNDVTVGPRGTFLLVTGSNMSGKSTLLRAIGLNVVLAQAGGPVCAAALRCPRVAVHTSMRIRDSLAEGVSYFMAEVLRLKQVVEAAGPDGGSAVLYLFDEMLQGTNAAERTVAAQRILLHLASTRALGALATHDLRLLDLPDVASTAHLVHFREDVVEGVDGPALHFDYHLRPGPASSTNALKLMELAGLPVAPSQESTTLSP
jgi:hypothetical protein